MGTFPVRHKGTKEGKRPHQSCHSLDLSAGLSAVALAKAEALAEGGSRWGGGGNGCFIFYITH